MSEDATQFPHAPLNPNFQKNSQDRYRQLRDRLKRQQESDFKTPEQRLPPNSNKGPFFG